MNTSEIPYDKFVAFLKHYKLGKREIMALTECSPRTALNVLNPKKDRPCLKQIKIILNHYGLDLDKLISWPLPRLTHHANQKLASDKSFTEIREAFKPVGGSGQLLPGSTIHPLMITNDPIQGKVIAKGISNQADSLFQMGQYLSAYILHDKAAEQYESIELHSEAYREYIRCVVVLNPYIAGDFLIRSLKEMDRIFGNHKLDFDLLAESYGHLLISIWNAGYKGSLITDFQLVVDCFAICVERSEILTSGSSIQNLYWSFKRRLAHEIGLKSEDRSKGLRDGIDMLDDILNDQIRHKQNESAGSTLVSLACLYYDEFSGLKAGPGKREKADELKKRLTQNKKFFQSGTFWTQCAFHCACGAVEKVLANYKSANESLKIAYKIMKENRLVAPLMNSDPFLIFQPDRMLNLEKSDHLHVRSSAILKDKSIQSFRKKLRTELEKSFKRYSSTSK